MRVKRDTWGCGGIHGDAELQGPGMVGHGDRMPQWGHIEDRGGETHEASLDRCFTQGVPHVSQYHSLWWARELHHIPTKKVCVIESYISNIYNMYIMICVIYLQLINICELRNQ